MYFSGKFLVTDHYMTPIAAFDDLFVKNLLVEYRFVNVSVKHRQLVCNAKL